MIGDIICISLSNNIIDIYIYIYIHNLMLSSIWFGGDDAIVKYWDVTSKIPLLEL